MEWFDRPLARSARLFSRRDLLGLLARGAGSVALVPPLLGLLGREAFGGAQESQKSQKSQDPAAPRRHKRLVLLWLEGGPSQLDTFDPKPGGPTGGPFGALPTAIAGWTIGSLLPRLATQAERLAVVRTLTSKEGSHARAREQLHSGYTPNPAVAFPTLGSIVAHEIGDLDSELPAFVQILGPPGSAGYLGIESAPFRVDDPTKDVGNVAYPKGVDGQRMELREGLREVLDREFTTRGGAAVVHADLSQRRRAHRLIDSKLRSAFDLGLESDATRDAYGRSTFGQGVLLARRLLESGVTSVEVVLDGWDTHVDNHQRTQALCTQLDPAFAALLDDLAMRGLLEETLVVCMGEFGRTPKINVREGRDHWPNNYCVALAGGGVRAGTVVGATDASGEQIVARPVQVADLFATIAELLGIERDKEFKSGRRPVKLIDPNGIVVPELLG